MPAPSDPIKRKEWIEKIRASALKQDLGHSEKAVYWRTKSNQERKGKTAEEIYGKEKAEEWKLKISKPKSIKPSAEHRERASKRLKGRIITWGEKISKTKKGVFQSETHKQNNKMAQQKIAEMERQEKEKDPTYQPNRDSINYRVWKKQVNERDNYICQKCKLKFKVLHAHHILPWDEFPEFRFVVSNGTSYCVKCHMLEHKRVQTILWKALETKLSTEDLISLVREGKEQEEKIG